MDKGKLIQVINAEIASCTGADIASIVYEIIVEKELDKKALRNKAIKSDFNTAYRANKKRIMDIYEDIAYDYGLESRTVNYIISK